MVFARAAAIVEAAAAGPLIVGSFVKAVRHFWLSSCFRVKLREPDQPDPARRWSMSSAGPSVRPSVLSRRRRAAVAQPADTAVLRHPDRLLRAEAEAVTRGYVERRDLRQTDGEAILLRSSTVPS